MKCLDSIDELMYGDCSLSINTAKSDPYSTFYLGDL
jgi:hypothetical protein